MSSRRVHTIMLIAIALTLALSVGTVVFGNNMLKSKSVKLQELKLEDKVLEEQQASLLQAKKDLEKYKTLEDIAKAIVPKDKDQAKAVREINQLAAASNINLVSISFPSSSLGQKATPAKTEEGTSAKTETKSISQAKPVAGINGVYQVAVTLTSDPSQPITFDQLVDFLQQLEKNRRTAQVSDLNIDPDTKDRNRLTFSLTINIYTKP
jgi:hypothetical protein